MGKMKLREIRLICYKTDLKPDLIPKPNVDLKMEIFRMPKQNMAFKLCRMILLLKTRKL